MPSYPFGIQQIGSVGALCRVITAGPYAESAGALTGGTCAVHAMKPVVAGTAWRSSMLKQERAFILFPLGEIATQGFRPLHGIHHGIGWRIRLRMMGRAVVVLEV